QAGSGDIIIPKMHSVCLRDLIDLFQGARVQVIGKRPGEKMHETLYVKGEINTGYETDQYYVLNRDRKSTRLNSSHEWISYAVFCSTTHTFTLSLHDALPISGRERRHHHPKDAQRLPARPHRPIPGGARAGHRQASWREDARDAVREGRDQHRLRDGSVLCVEPRSEEHTSELQSRVDLVCRLLLHHPHLHSVPTRRSSDLRPGAATSSSQRCTAFACATSSTYSRGRACRSSASVLARRCTRRCT